jgi:hypothetical protein
VGVAHATGICAIVLKLPFDLPPRRSCANLFLVEIHLSVASIWTGNYPNRTSMREVSRGRCKFHINSEVAAHLRPASKRMAASYDPLVRPTATGEQAREILGINGERACVENICNAPALASQVANGARQGLGAKGLRYQRLWSVPICKKCAAPSDQSDGRNQQPCGDLHGAILAFSAVGNHPSGFSERAGFRGTAALLEQVAPATNDGRGEHVLKIAVGLAPRLDQALPIPPSRPGLSLVGP